MESASRTMMPQCIKNERPLLVTTQVKLVDPADEYVTCNYLLSTVSPLTKLCISFIVNYYFI